MTKLANLDFLSDLELDSKEYSYSRGIFLENLWVALANPINPSGMHTAVGAYMRAYDRVACQRAAETFAEHEFRIGSFGSGRVMIYLGKQEDAMAKELSFVTGMNPPMSMISGE